MIIFAVTYLFIKMPYWVIDWLGLYEELVNLNAKEIYLVEFLIIVILAVGSLGIWELYSENLLKLQEEEKEQLKTEDTVGESQG